MICPEGPACKTLKGTVDCNFVGSLTCTGEWHYKVDPSEVSHKTHGHLLLSI